MTWHNIKTIPWGNVVLRTDNKCPCCNGTGKIKETEFVDGDFYTCMTCDGTGKY